MREIICFQIKLKKGEKNMRKIYVCETSELKVLSMQTIYSGLFFAKGSLSGVNVSIFGYYVKPFFANR